MTSLRCVLVSLLLLGGALGCRAQPASEFLPPVEEFIRDDGEREDMFMDLDSGRLWTPPAALRGAPQRELLSWMRETGVDVVCEVVPSVRGLIGFEMVAIPVGASVWTATRGEVVRERLSWAQPGTPVTLSGKGDLPATFIIRTREGGAGVLQITRLFDDPPRGARIRYKLLATAEPQIEGAPVAAAIPAATDAVFSATADLVAATGGADTPEGVLAAARARLALASAEYLEARRLFDEGSLSWSGLRSAAEARSEARLRVEEAAFELARARGGDVAAARRRLREARIATARDRVSLLSEELQRCRSLVAAGGMTSEELEPLEKDLAAAERLLELMQE